MKPLRTEAGEVMSSNEPGVSLQISITIEVICIIQVFLYEF